MPGLGSRQGSHGGIYSSYNLARMPFEVILAPEALDDFRRLIARDRAMVRDAMEVHLRHQPRSTSKSRIKRLKGIRRPQFRLRVDDIRVFYDVVDASRVEVLAIVKKADAANWLDQFGEVEEES